MRRQAIRLLLTMIAAGSMAASASAQSVAKGKNEVTTDVFFISSKPSGDAIDAERSTTAELTVGYARFVTDRVAVGPLFRISKATDADTSGYVGGLGRFYFGDLAKRAIPFAEVNSTRSFNDPFGDFTDVQLMAGVMFPLGSSGGRFRIAPYYYRAFYDEAETGYSNYQSFGISWSVGLLF
jgi:hypothetical protein